MDLKETILKIRKLAEVEVKDDKELKRVEIIMLKFKESKEVIDDAISRIIHNTNWPFKLTIFDNRPNTPNTSRVWNKLVRESTCDHILLIDSDAFVPKCEPCWLTRMMESIDETGVVIPVSNQVGGAHQKVSGPEDYPSSVINTDVWSGFCFLFTKDVFKKLGDFDEKYYIYGSDSEWSLRVGANGGAVMRKDVFVEHIGSYSFNQDPIREEDKLYARTLFKIHLNKYGKA